MCFCGKSISTLMTKYCKINMSYACLCTLQMRLHRGDFLQYLLIYYPLSFLYANTTLWQFSTLSITLLFPPPRHDHVSSNVDSHLSVPCTLDYVIQPISSVNATKRSSSIIHSVPVQVLIMLWQR